MISVNADGSSMPRGSQVAGGMILVPLVHVSLVHVILVPLVHVSLVQVPLVHVSLVHVILVPLVHGVVLSTWHVSFYE
jgi:hypothetical protein